MFDTYKHHYTGALFIFNIFVSMSSPRTILWSIYVIEYFLNGKSAASGFCLVLLINYCGKKQHVNSLALSISNSYNIPEPYPLSCEYKTEIGFDEVHFDEKKSALFYVCTCSIFIIYQIIHSESATGRAQLKMMLLKIL